MTELRRFLEMLERAGIGHGIRHDSNPPGEAVQVECDGSGRRWTIAKFVFDADGRLKLEVYRRAHKAEELVRQFLRDWDEDDTAIRDLCRPVLGDAAVDGDSHGVPPLPDVVKATIEKLREGKP